MSWAKVKKINSNMSKSLDTLITEVKTALTTLIQGVTTNVNTQVQNVNTNVNTQTQSVTTNVNTNVNTKVQGINNHLNDLKYQSIRIITATGTFKPEKTGKYKVICVGAGGAGNSYRSNDSAHALASGGGGGVSIKTLRLLSTTSYNVTVSTTASFTHESGSLTATAGSTGTPSNTTGGTGGTASGGDFNYIGTNGTSFYANTSSNKRICPSPGSVGVFISDLSRSVESTWLIINAEYGTCQIRYGNSILGYGGAGSAVADINDSSKMESVTVSGLPAAVIIVPIEMEG